MEEVAEFSQVIDSMEREMGFEPTTSSLGSWHSTTELHPHRGGSGLETSKPPQLFTIAMMRGYGKTSTARPCRILAQVPNETPKPPLAGRGRTVKMRALSLRKITSRS